MRTKTVVLWFVIAGMMALSAACIPGLTPPPGERPPTRTQPSGPGPGGFTPKPPQATSTGTGPNIATRIPRPTATEESGSGLPGRPTAALGTGMIAGSLSYPSEYIPALRVVAFNAGTMVMAAHLDTQENDSFYTMSLPVGTYYVVAYTMDGMLEAGYSQAVLCGLTVSCTDHSLVPVQVLANMSLPNIDPGDWYAPPGTFPPMP